MLFSSIEFLLYFLPCVLILYYALSFSRKLQNILLLLASLFFYAWGEPRYVLLMIASILVNAALGGLIGKADAPKKKKLLLILAIILNTGALFVMKYLTFIWGLLGLDRWYDLSIPLPIGISFFTFQALSYVIDVYRGKVKAANIFRVGLYISFFPQLIAGPILQYGEIETQITGRKLSFDRLSVGICRFTAGLGKKVFLANAFAAVADHVFNWTAIGADYMTVPAALAWLGSIAYTLQIYFDFSAYSDMAIGLGLCFGFKFPENFNYPYIAASVSDFWKRWHISLTNWFRQYVYFPLGGSRVENKDVMVRNLFLVWLLTGIWHGANWTFLFWGLMYFAFQLMERFSGFPAMLPGRFLKHLYTLLIVNLLWVVFRADDLYQAGRFFLNMFALNNNGVLSDVALMLVKENWLQFLLGILFCMPVARKLNETMHANPAGRLNSISSILYPVAMLCLLVVCVSYLISGSYNPFIYFNF